MPTPTKVTQYKTTDGKLFEDSSEAAKYQAAIDGQTNVRVCPACYGVGSKEQDPLWRWS